MFPSGRLMNLDAYQPYEEFHHINNCTITLENRQLWTKFHELETEMIITKTGRRMFPSLHVKIDKLDPKAFYSVIVEMEPVSHNRYKYSTSAGWAPAGTEEAHNAQRIYIHPYSPATGEYWMSQVVSFGRMKLTNSMTSDASNLVLNSMHKYQPRIIVTQSSSKLAWGHSISKVFPETQFIAVTAYQNERITQLKIDTNPFARGFRTDGQARCKRKRNETERSGEDEEAKQTKMERLSPPLEDKADKSFSSSQPSSPCSNESLNESGYSRQTVVPGGPDTMAYPLLFHPCYYPYSSYSPAMWSFERTPPVYFHRPFLPTPNTNNLVVRERSPHEETKKFTDFSIRAITGSS